MIVKAKKTAGGYLIPDMPVWENKDVIYLKIYAASDESMLSEEKNQKSAAIKKIEETNARLGGNPFLELKLKHLPKDFEYKQTGSDEDNLYSFETLDDVWKITKDIRGNFDEDMLMGKIPENDDFSKHDYKELVGTAIMERYREKDARSDPVKQNISHERLLFRKKYGCEDIFSINDVLRRLENAPL